MVVNQAEVSPDLERLTFSRPTDSSPPEKSPEKSAEKSADGLQGCESLLYATLETRLYLLETAVKELHESVKAKPIDLYMSMSDIQISPSTKNLVRADSSSVIVPPEVQHPSYDEPPTGRANLRHMSSDSTVSRQSGSPPAFINQTQRRLSAAETQDLNTRMSQLNKKCKEMIRRNRIKVEEVDSKLSNLSDLVTRLRRTVSCDEAEVFVHSFVHFS